MTKYSKEARKKIAKVMHKFKEGTLKFGRKGKGGLVKSRKQAIAISLSEARVNIPTKKFLQDHIKK